MTCLAFSPDGQLLAAGGAAGSVLVWQLQSLSAAGPGGSSSLVATHSVAILAAADNGTAAGAAVGAVCWLPMPQGWALVTGNRNNAALQLWHSVSLEGSWKLLQTLQFEGKSGQQEFYSHVDVVPAQQLVVLADTARKAIYTLHYSGRAQCRLAEQLDCLTTDVVAPFSSLLSLALGAFCCCSSVITSSPPNHTCRFGCRPAV